MLESFLTKHSVIKCNYWISWWNECGNWWFTADLFFKGSFHYILNHHINWRWFHQRLKQDLENGSSQRGDIFQPCTRERSPQKHNLKEVLCVDVVRGGETGERRRWETRRREDGLHSAFCRLAKTLWKEKRHFKETEKHQREKRRISVKVVSVKSRGLWNTVREPLHSLLEFNHWPLEIKYNNCIPTIQFTASKRAYRWRETGKYKICHDGKAEQRLNHDPDRIRSGFWTTLVTMCCRTKEHENLKVVSWLVISN